MSAPALPDLGHDLRNLVGLLRALSVELSMQLDGATAEVKGIASELDRQTRFALEALRVVEKWESDQAVEVELGALAWGMRLVCRELNVGDVDSGKRVSVPVRSAIAEGARIVRALGGGRAVGADVVGDALELAIRGAAADAATLDAAAGALRKLGLTCDVRARAGGVTVRIA